MLILKKFPEGIPRSSFGGKGGTAGSTCGGSGVKGRTKKSQPPKWKFSPGQLGGRSLVAWGVR